MVEGRGEGAEGPGTMASPMLRFGRHLSKGNTEVGEEEEGVVSESTFTEGVWGDDSGARAEGGEGSVIVGPGENGGADVVSGPARCGHIGQAIEEELVVRAVELCAVEVGPSREALAMDARCAVEGVHSEPGVVGQGGQAGQAGEVRGLGSCVFLESLVGFEAFFFSGRWDAEVGEAEDFDAGAWGEDLAHLTELIRASGAQDPSNRINRSHGVAGG